MSEERTKVWYFGCVGREGHYLHRFDTPYPVRGELAPVELLDRAEVWCATSPSQYQGWARLTHAFGFTFIGFYDRSVDSRPGSFSLFIIHDFLEWEKAVAAARAAFPEIWRRYTFEVKLVENR